MALLPLLSFSSGELDPILTDNVTLEKFKKGLATARNVMIGKTGSILSRFSRYHAASAKTPGQSVKGYCPPNTDYLLEWGVGYVRVYLFDTTTFMLNLQVELAHSFVEADLPKLHFITSKDYVYVFCAGKTMLKLQLGGVGSAFVASGDMFDIPNPLQPMAVSSSGAPSGYAVDYLATLVINGEESLHVESGGSGYSKPIAAGQSNTISVGWLDASIDIGEVREMRVYSRPHGGGAYGYLGSTTKFSVVGPNRVADFVDLGSLPDYANGVQDLVTKEGLNGKDIIDLKPTTGIVYQQRLILTDETDKEALVASRPGFHNNFYRDFPYASDSALLFKAGTSGKAEVLRIIESDGIVVFTTNGVYTNSGILNVNNTALDRKGGWVINENIPPLLVPGGLFFVDRSNTIRQMVFSQDILAYESVEQTIFSNHLFTERTIESWAFQNGVAPLIIVTFSDGTFASFTYNFEHQMRAWTRHDSKYPVEQVIETGKDDRSFFIVNKDGTRSIEVSLPRRVPVAVKVDDTESDMSAINAYMDSIETTSSLLNRMFSTTVDHFTLTPVTLGDWSGELTLECTDTGFFGAVVVGDVFRFFHPVDKSIVDLTVTALVDAETVTVEPSDEFPSDYATIARLYETYTTITGLNHLEGEKVSVMVDGSLVASPYNDVEGYPELTVTGGSITLPSRGAIIHVGRPIVGDTKTLNISTVEQSPTLIESINVNKLYVRVNQTRGLYCSNKFPEEHDGDVDGTSVEGMESLDEALIPKDDILIGNTYFKPVSKRIERTIPGSWDSQGQISIRQVDPYHFEILSIIPDVQVLRRSDR